MRWSSGSRYALEQVERRIDGMVVTRFVGVVNRRRGQCRRTWLMESR